MRGPLPRRPAARRLLRRRLAGGGEHGRPRTGRGRAVAMVMLGLSVANVIGVPAATWLGQNLGWRAAYWAVAGLALLTMALRRAAFVPVVPGRPRGHRPARAARPSPSRRCGSPCWPARSASAACSPCTPTSRRWSPTSAGCAESAVPVFLLAFGLGMVAGTWVAGELADWSVFRSLLGSSIGLGVVAAAPSPRWRRTAGGAIVPALPGHGARLGARGRTSSCG